ncbi:MAG: 23S rRNA (guanosine(2251)-2'-O)-methyltransferase RlmB [Eubacterium sp.]|nr:23S rRNA (guanosine(2251)-2'-O)-methyltransferase RlmB [Eubacterium sp.]
MSKRDNPRYREENAERFGRGTSGKAGRGKNADRGSRGAKAAGREERREPSRAPKREARPFREDKDRRDRRNDRDLRDSRREDRAPSRSQAGPEAFSGSSDLIIGRNPVTEALKSGRTIEKLILQDGATGSASMIYALAKERGIPVERAEKQDLDKLAGNRAHQGAAAIVSPYDYAEPEALIRQAEEACEDPILLVLDEIEDPHNLGAIMRTAECAGAGGILIPKRHGCGLTETVAKTSAGAIEYMPVARVTNIARTLEELKEKGYWICACDMDGTPYTKADLTGKIALVIGNEGKGISRLVKEKCDFTISIPMKGHINSLNASNAAAIVLYEAVRQRTK